MHAILNNQLTMSNICMVFHVGNIKLTKTQYAIVLLQPIEWSQQKTSLPTD